MATGDFPFVSIVIIGHNEGRNLESCFNAIRNIDYPQDKIETIFVNSNSNDNSSEIAGQYTNKVIEIRSQWPTAGEAFNKGIKNASSDYVHITAGDIQLHPDYLRKAIIILEKDKEIQAVTGFFVEKESKGWNKIISFRREEDKNLKDHFVKTPNGGTFKKSALISVNGYDERIKKGQETELGSRFAEIGYKILFLNIPQGVHDFEIKSIIDMIKRNYLNGFSLGYMLNLNKFEKSNKFIKPFFRNAIKTIILNAGMLLLLVGLIIYGGLKMFFVWIIFYILYFPTSVLIKQRNKTAKHKIYFIINGYFTIINFIGIAGFAVYNIRMKAMGINLFNEKKGLN